MRWPFMWRHEAEAIIREAQEIAQRHITEMSDMATRTINGREQDAQRYERDMVRQESRYADLLQRYTALRLRGFDDPKPTPAPVVKPQIDPVIEAVDLVSARFDPKVRAEMLRQVAVDRKLEIPDDEIIARIHRGYRPSDEIQ